MLNGIGDSAESVHFEQNLELETALLAAASPEKTHPSMGAYPRLNNIVSTVDLDCDLDLIKLTLHARNAEYNPRRFSAVIIRLSEPKSTGLVFRSGKLVCTGARNIEASRLAARKLALIIQKIGYAVKFIDFKVQNIVATSDVRFPIDLEQIALTHVRFCTYEPEIFPGLVYRMLEPKVSLLVFVTGKVVLTGAKTLEDLNSAFAKIYPLLFQARKKNFSS